MKKITVILSYWNLEPEFKEEGETCGACNTTSGDCGKCKPGLECVANPSRIHALILQNLPSRCRAPTSSTIFRFVF